jgi:hypothetical protein
VDVDSYSIELKDEDGFLGDRASKGAILVCAPTVAGVLGIGQPRTGDLQRMADSPGKAGPSGLEQARRGDDPATCATLGDHIKNGPLRRGPLKWTTSVGPLHHYYSFQ